MMKFIKTILLVCGILTIVTLQAKEVEIKNGNIVLDFSSKVSQTSSGKYIVKRAIGRFGEYTIIGKTSSTTFIDKKVKENPYSYYYQIIDDAGNLLALMGMDIELFGENVHIYNDMDDKQSIGNDVNGIHEAMFGKEFSPDRYALLFKPGNYQEAGLLKIPFYVHLAGLGRTPYEVEIYNVHTPPHLRNGNGTCTFWRSMENMAVIGPETYDEEQTFKWAVSQAAPIRRVYSQRIVRNQWENGWVSGGFTADCYFDAAAGSKNQQQWYTRNSYLNKGRGKFEEIKYNYCFQGVELGSEVDKDTYKNNWDKGGNVTFIPTTPIIREKPFLFIDTDGRYKVFRPALRRDCLGVSYSRTDMGKGDIIDLLDSFYVVKPGVSATEMNRQLKNKKHLLITPGMYELSEPLHVIHPNTIILGIGWATLIPGAENSDTAIRINNVVGVSVASILFDAHYTSNTLIQIGNKEEFDRHIENPTLLADLFFRIGGFRPAKVHVDHTVEINSNDVIGDHFWIWRADHGVHGSVGWEINTAKNGLVVNGNHVTIYGLFNEHFQEYQTYWTGEYGRTYFYQCETPYDAPSQKHYMSENNTRPGYAAYKVADSVNIHEGTAFGIYDVLHRDIMIENSVEVPDKIGIKMYHICNNTLSGGGLKGFNYILNGIGKSTYNTYHDNRVYINEFKGNK